MTDLVTDISARLLATIPEFTHDKAADFEQWIRRVYGMERYYISARGEVDREIGARNRAILREHRAGESNRFLARKYKISPQRIGQIING